MKENNLYPSPCGYFENLTSQNSLYHLPDLSESVEFVESGNESKNLPPKFCQQLIFASMLERGFRRSDNILYRAECPACRKCKGIRIHVKDFVPTKSQRHIFRINSDISVSICRNCEEFISDEKVLLFSLYDKRHNPSSKKNFAQYKQELAEMNGIHETSEYKNTESSYAAAYSGTINMEYRLNSSDGNSGKLIGCGITDIAVGCLSSDYFYYDTSEQILKRSIGTFSILKELELCRTTGFEYYYLGYWIADCRKMVYKSNFRPYQLLECCGNNEWQDIQNESD